MKNKLIFSLSIILISLLSLVACGPKSKPQETDKILTAYRLIDEQRADEAIALMENALIEEPNQDQYKEVLASAYAHKAGIKIQTLAPAITQGQKIKSIKMAPQESSGNSNQTVQNMASMFAGFSSFFEVYAAIPLVDADHVAYLEQSIAVLNSLTKTKQENALYRAVLEIVLLKHYLADGVVGEVPTASSSDLTAKDQKVTCQIDFEETKSNLAKLGKLFIDICGDLSLSNPNNGAQLKKNSEQATAFVSSLVSSTNTVTAIDEAANIFLKDMAVQYGLGKIIKCGGS
jgi:hypothetical protein